MFRSILAVVAGVILAVALVAAAETVSHFTYPPPAGLDLGDSAAVKSWVGSLPFGAFAVVLIGWTLGAFAGTASAVLIAGRRPAAGCLVAVLFLTATLFNLVTLPSPAWFRIAGVLLVVTGPMLAILKLSRTAPQAPLAQA
jgi:hypothetical protein